MELEEEAREAYTAARHQRLLEYLRKEVPRERWTQTNFRGWTFAHSACLVGNLDALRMLLAAGCNPSAEADGTPCLRIAVAGSNATAVELLLAAGATLYPAALTECFRTSLHCARILIANGSRMDVNDIFNIPLPLIAFQRGVIRCRTTVTAMLRVRRVAQLFHWDKFLLAYISHAIWATRYDESWAP